MHLITVNKVSPMFDVGCSIFDIRCSILKSGSGETWARPKATYNITMKDAPFPDVNEKFNFENFTEGKYLASCGFLLCVLNIHNHVIILLSL